MPSSAKRKSARATEVLRIAAETDFTNVPNLRLARGVIPYPRDGVQRPDPECEERMYSALSKMMQIDNGSQDDTAAGPLRPKVTKRKGKRKPAGQDSRDLTARFSSYKQSEQRDARRASPKVPAAGPSKLANNKNNIAKTASHNDDATIDMPSDV